MFFLKGRWVGDTLFCYEILLSLCKSVCPHAKGVERPSLGSFVTSRRQMAEDVTLCDTTVGWGGWDLCWWSREWIDACDLGDELELMYGKGSEFREECWCRVILDTCYSVALSVVQTLTTGYVQCSAQCWFRHRLRITCNVKRFEQAHYIYRIDIFNIISINVQHTQRFHIFIVIWSMW